MMEHRDYDVCSTSSSSKMDKYLMGAKGTSIAVKNRYYESLKHQVVSDLDGESWRSSSPNVSMGNVIVNMKPTETDQGDDETGCEDAEYLRRKSKCGLVIKPQQCAGILNVKFENESSSPGISQEEYDKMKEDRSVAFQKNKSLTATVSFMNDQMRQMQANVHNLNQLVKELNSAKISQDEKTFQLEKKLSACQEHLKKKEERVSAMAELLNRQNEVHAFELSVCKKQVEDKEERISEMAEQLNEQNKVHANEVKKREENFHRQEHEKGLEIQKMNGMIDGLLQEKGEMNVEYNTLLDELKIYDNRKRESEEVMRQMQENVDNSNQLVKEINYVKNSQDKKTFELQKELSACQEHLKEKEERIYAMEEQLKHQNEVHAIELSVCKKQEEDKEERISEMAEQLKQQNEAHATEIGQQANIVESLKIKNTNLQSFKNNLEGKITETEEQNEKKDAELAALRTQLDNMQSLMASILEHCDSNAEQQHADQGRLNVLRQMVDNIRYAGVRLIPAEVEILALPATLETGED